MSPKIKLWGDVLRLVCIQLSFCVVPVYCIVIVIIDV